MDAAIVTQAQEVIAKVFERHTTPVLWLSGGRDSLALLHLLRPWHKSVTLLRNHLDGGWPGVTENLMALAESWGFSLPIFTHPRLTFEDYVAQYGYQTEVVPTDADTVIVPASPWHDGSLLVSSFWHCTLLRSIYPLLEATMALGADAILTGSRASDAPLFAMMGAEAPQGKDVVGYVRYNPLNAWTTEEVYAYIDEHHIPLPEHYQWKRQMEGRYAWPDCLRCTAQPEHWQLLREHYPDVYAEHWPEVKRVYEALAVKQWDYTKRLMRVVMEGSDVS